MTVLIEALYRTLRSRNVPQEKFVDYEHIEISVMGEAL